MLCSGRPLSFAFYGADDGDSRTGRRRGADSRGVAAPGAGNLGGGGISGRAEFYRVGGAQAIAALAYGTEEMPRVDKIVGPGNRYVTAAKKLVAFDCAIEFLAGPTEAVFVSDDGDPRFIASDLVAQAEHDPDALCIFITTSRELAKKVRKEVGSGAVRAIQLPRSRSPAAAPFFWSLLWNRRSRSRIALRLSTLRCRRLWRRQCNMRARFSWTNSRRSPRETTFRDRITFCPRAAMARVRGGLSVLDFVRIIACQQVSREGIRRIGPPGIVLAEAEGLRGHAESFRVRLSHA